MKNTDIDAIWDEVLPVMEKVLRYNFGFYSMDDVKSELKDGGALLICVKDGDELLACITCKEMPHPTKRVLSMPVVCGTRMNDWIDLCQETTRKLAKELGYDMLITRGRKGWTKVLKGYGYKEIYVALGIDL